MLNVLRKKSAKCVQNKTNFFFLFFFFVLVLDIKIKHTSGQKRTIFKGLTNNREHFIKKTKNKTTED